MASSLHVFISFKNLDDDGRSTRDSTLAREVYERLTAQGLNVFFSNISLEQMGADEYKRAIDNALDEAVVMVAVGTSTENLNSKWVRYEWDSFYNDILSGLKQGSRFFTYVENVDTRTLPRTIRHNQVFKHPDDLSSMLQYIIKALAARALHLAREAMAGGRYEEAVQCLSEVVDREPNNAEALTELDEARRALAAEQEARQRQIEQEQRDRRLADLMSKSGELLAGGRFREAVAAFEQVLSENPDHAPAREGLAKARTGLQREEENKGQQRMDERLAPAVQAEAGLAAEQRRVQRADETERRAREKRRRTWRRRVLPVAIGLVVVAGLAAGWLVIKGQHSASQVSGWLARAERAGAEKRYRGARDLYRRVLTVDGDNALARAGLVATERRLNDINRQVGPLLVSGERAFLAKRLGRARRDFMTVLKVDPANAEAKQALAKIQTAEKQILISLRLARSALAEKRLAEAKRYYLRIISMDVDHEASRQALARLETTRRRIDQLLASARAATDKKEPAAAREHYLRVLSLESDNRAAKQGLAQISSTQALVTNLTNQARAALRERRPGRARKLLDRVALLDVSNPAARKLQGRLGKIEKRVQTLLARATDLEKAGQLDQASGLYRQVLADYPGQPQAREALQRLQTRGARVKAKARRLVSQALELKKAKKWDGVIRLTTEALQLDSGLVGAYVTRGTAQLMRGRLKSALEDFDRALAKGLTDKRTLAVVYGNRCFTLLRLERAQKALADCSRCISLAPKMAEAYGVRAMVYRRLGKAAEARRDEASYQRLKRR